MKTPLLLAAFLAFSLGAKAVDTTPPTLNITHTWIEKVGTVVHFKMLLDPQDETGFSPLVGPPPGNTPGRTIEFRSKLNSTAALPANTPWNAFPYPWIRGEPFDVPFNCTSVVFELRAVDAAGNVSPLQRRTFASPFPFSPPPNLRPQVIPGEVQRAGSAANVRGLFVGRFDGVGISDDLVQVDRATGNIMVRRQINGQPVQSDVSFSLPADTIEDSASADFDTDSRADLAIIASGALTVYHNDGLDGDGVVQFGAQTVSLAGTGITTFNNIAVGDVTGDGKLDIVVSGTDSGGAPRIGWLIANATWQYDSSSGAPAPSGTTPGKLALGDMNGDGTLDVVMVDSANNQMIVFKNKGAGVIAGDGETDVNYQPVLIPTGLGQAGPDPTIPLIAASVRALTVGDVTGDGRPDILTVFSEILFTNPLDSNDGRTQQRWRLYENRGASGIRPHTDVLLGQSPASQTVLEDIPSDVMLMELNNDRFPEILFTNYYNNSVRIIRFTALLDHQNFLTTLDDGSGNPELDEQEYVPVVSTGPTLVGPSRLAKGKLYTNASVNSIAMSFAGSNAVRWELNATRTTTKPHDIIGGATTDSDASGVAGSNGTYSYTEYPGGGITYSLTYVNNTATALTGVTLESALPADFFLQSNDEGGVVSGTGASRVIRWTLDVPENSAGVKSFRVNLIATTKVASFAPKIILKQGAKILVTSAMPLVKLGTTNFTVVPNSPGQPWLFTYKPTVLPENAVAAVQTSPDGVNWTLIFSNNMTQVPGTIPVCTLSASDVPTTSRYFRALTWSNTTGYKYSSVFNNFLPPTTGLSLSSKSPAKSGQLWTFSATQSSTAGNVGVRFQSTTTPENGTSWSDLPIYTPTIRSGNVWT
ncbi:MAG: VCBS repeat-containing protein, partial [Prosthecobacter sp.]